VRQLSSAFPGGRSGLALMLLRFALGWVGVAEGVNCFNAAANFESLSLSVIFAVSGVLVVIGLFTPFSATAIALGTAYRALTHSSTPPSVLLQSPFFAGILIVLGISVTLLGPGLFSMDFRLFGRREIIIPRRTRE
jgi:uncharacterized membrane protein YphA (DoxX/SURF4 family)